MNDVTGRGGRKVAVLGPIPRDQVVTAAGERFHKYGCVMYTAVALSAPLDHPHYVSSQPPSGSGG